MSIDLGEGLLLKAPVEAAWAVQGNTAANKPSTGLRRVWQLALPNGTELPVWDTTWASMERDIVLGAPKEVPEIPREVERLLERRRASVESVPSQRMLFMSVYLVLPDAAGWPRLKKSINFGELLDNCGDNMIYGLNAHGVVEIGTKGELLGETGRSRNELCSLLNRECEAGPIATYVVTRVVPILRHTGILEP